MYGFVENENCVRMDLRYEFSKRSKTDLLEFLKIATEQKQNVYCDLNEYRSYKNIFKLEGNLKEELKEYIDNQITKISLLSDSEEENNEETNQEILHIASQEDISGYNQSSLDDITYAIKENLDIEKTLSSAIINNMLECSDEKLESIFKLLSLELNAEAVINFGLSLKSVETERQLVIICYIRYLLLKKLQLDYSEKLQELIDEYFCKYSVHLINEMVNILLNIDDNDSIVLLLYVDKLNADYKSLLFREFVFNCNKLHESYIPILEILLNNKTEFDSLNKLTEIMSNAATEFTSDKTYGKLLINVIQTLGKNMHHLEKPLKHIIGTHSSIWKTKIQKTFEASLEDSLLMSQSFRVN